MTPLKCWDTDGHIPIKKVNAGIYKDSNTIGTNFKSEVFCILKRLFSNTYLSPLEEWHKYKKIIGLYVHCIIAGWSVIWERFWGLGKCYEYFTILYIFFYWFTAGNFLHFFVQISPKIKILWMISFNALVGYCQMQLAWDLILISLFPK